MNDSKDAILYLKRVNKTFNYERKKLLCALKFIFCEAMERGLDDESMIVVGEMLTTTNLPIVIVEELAKCLIPRTYVPEAVIIDIAFWILSDSPDISKGKISIAVRWLTGIIYYGLSKSDKLENLYDLFFNLLLEPGLDNVVCPLIHLLTKSSRVTRRHILLLSNLLEAGKNRHITSLSGLLKYLQPHFVPDYISLPECNQYSVGTFSEFDPGFQLAKERCKQQENSATSMEVVECTQSRNAKVQPTNTIIPKIAYLDPCPNHSQISYKLFEFERWETIGACSLDIEMPNQSLALLRCSFGLFTLAFGGPSIQMRFSRVLQSKLHNVFLEMDSDCSHCKTEVRMKSEKLLLQRLSTLQDYLGQPIPVVSSFLSKFLPLWDGDMHRVLFLRLMTYIHFSSYEELESCILDPLHLLFVTKDVEFKCNVINMLREFMKNLILKEEWRKGKDPLFLGVRRRWKTRNTYPKLFDFISDLIETGLSSENGDSFLLITALHYYHFMVSLQGNLDLDYLMIPPPAVMYHSLFSYNPVCLSLSCSLLVRYKLEIYPHVKNPENVKESLGNLGLYAVDYVNFLCNDEPFSKGASGYIFGNLKSSTVEDISKVMDIRFSSGLARHIAFIPYHHLYIQENTPTNFKVLLKTAESKFRGLYEFLETFCLT